MKKYIIYILLFLIVLSSAIALFGVKTPPPSPLGAYCSIYGCNFTGDIDMQWNQILNVILNNSILYNATILNGTFTGMVNSSQVANPIWVEKTGDNMTGPLYMNNNGLYDLLEITANDWANVTILESQITDLLHTAGDNIYLYNISTIMYFNDTKLNLTILSVASVYDDSGAITVLSNKITAVNTTANIVGLGFITGPHRAGDGIYLYNDSLYMYFNETKLNATVVLVASIYNNTDLINLVNTTSNIIGLGFTTGKHRIGGGAYLYNDSTSIYFNETKLLETISANSDFDTQKDTEGPYLYNDSTKIYFNETHASTVYYTQTAADLLFLTFAGGTLTGSLVIDGNLTVLGQILNASVENQYLNGSFLPSISGIFDIGSPTYYWQNLYVDSVLAKDWSNVTITESQITDLSPHKEGAVPFLYNDSTKIYFNETALDLQINGSILNQTGCSNPLVACTNRENLFEDDQRIDTGYKFYFEGLNNDTFFFYNATNATLQLYVNGNLQQDWGASTTVYGKATFLADAFFTNISGNAMVIDTNVLITGNLTVQEFYKGNGSLLTDVCHSDGTGCGSGQIDTQKAGASPYLYNDTTFIYFNETYLNGSITLIVNASTINWSNIANSPTNISYFNNDVGYITEANDTDTHVAGDGNYLTNDSTTMYFDVNKLNDTIDERSDFDTDTQKGTTGFYLYNDSLIIYFNETQLNATIVALDQDYIAGGVYILLNGNIFSLNESKLNDTIEQIDTDTQKGTVGPYLYNDTVLIYFNETHLNQTIGLLDTDTTYTTDEIYINLNGTLFQFNETKLLEIIYANSDFDTQKSAVGPYLYNDSTTIYFNETQLNKTIELLDTDTTYNNGTGLDLIGTKFSLNINYTDGRYYTQTIADTKFLLVTGGIVDGNVIFNGNFTIIGDMFNASVTNQFLNGSLIPDLNNMFTLGTPTDYWNAAYITKFYSNDWSNVSLTESQITDLTHTSAGLPYLYQVGSLIYLNETKLNQTISDIDIDTQKGTNGFYLYNDSLLIYFNETKLNSTIELLDTDTIYAAQGLYIILNDTIFYLNETKLNDTITQIVQLLDTQKDTEGPYLYNDSVKIYFNETQLNNTIILVVGNTTINWENIIGEPTFVQFGDNIYLYLSGDTLYLNETKLNQTIELLDTHVEGTDYLYNDSTYMYLNETKLNATIDNRDNYEPDTRVTGTGYLFNDSTYIYLNGTLLNETIDERDTNTEKKGGIPYLYNDSTYIYINETKLNQTIQVLDTDTQKGTTGFYLYNNSLIIYFNESKLNATIELLDNDTLYFAKGIYILLDINNTFYLNESKLNNTIIDVVNSLGLINTEKSGATPYLYNDSDFIYLNETKLNSTIDNRGGSPWNRTGTEVNLYNTNDSVIIGDVTTNGVFEVRTEETQNITIVPGILSYTWYRVNADFPGTDETSKVSSIDTVYSNVIQDFNNSQYAYISLNEPITNGDNITIRMKNTNGLYLIHNNDKTITYASWNHTTGTNPNTYQMTIANITNSSTLDLYISYSSSSDVTSIQYDNSDGNRDTGQTNTLSYTVGSGSDRILVAMTIFRDDGIEKYNNIVFNGNETFTEVVGMSNSRYTSTYQLWYLKNPTVTTANIIATGTVNPAIGGVMVIWSFNGVDLNNSLPTQVADPDSWTNYGASGFTTQYTDSWVLGAVLAQTTNLAMTSSDYTSVYESDTSPSIFASMTGPVSIGTYSLTWVGTGTTGGYVYHVELKKAAATSSMMDTDYFLINNVDNTVSISSRVSASNDDAEECESDGTMEATNGNLKITYNGGVTCLSGPQYVGIRFRNIQVPQGATILNATIEFQVNETTFINGSVNITGEDADTTLPFIAGNNYNISNRTRTTAQIEWTLPSVGSIGNKKLTNNISIIVQKIIDRTGWTSGNNMTIILLPSAAQRIYESWDGDNNNAPLLRITYSTTIVHTNGGDSFIVLPNGNVGIKTDNPLYDLHVIGDIYATDTIIAQTFVDLTAGYDKSSRSALTELINIRSTIDKKGNIIIDHSTLPDFVRASVLVLDKENRSTIVEGRDIGKISSMIIEAIKLLDKRQSDMEVLAQEQEERIINQENTIFILQRELCNKNNTYSWCRSIKKY